MKRIMIAAIRVSGRTRGKRNLMRL